MISYRNFERILNDLERGYAKIQGCWFPEFWERQAEVEKSRAYRKLTMMVNTDMEEAFKEGDWEKALSIWTILVESMKVITAFPEENKQDLERLHGLYNDYEKMR